MMKYVLFILPVLLWTVVIFNFSSQPYKEQSIQPFLKENFTKEQFREKLPNVTLRYRTSEINAKQSPFQFIEFLFRKGAHLFIYGMLAVLAFIAMHPYKEKTFAKVILILLFVALVAMTDEWNQSTSQMRTGAIQDVGIDLLGATIGLMLIISWRGITRRGSKSSVM